MTAVTIHQAKTLIAGGGVTALPISLEHARIAGSLPGAHRDPFDRMLAAQAQLEGLTLISADPVFGALGLPVLWN